LLRARPDLEVTAIRGNVETRLARALGEDADLDAVVLAASGLQRVGRDEVISELLPVEVMLPAPAQGALAVEVAAHALRGAGGPGAGGRRPRPPGCGGPGPRRCGRPGTRRWGRCRYQRRRQGWGRRPGRGRCARLVRRTARRGG